MCAFAVRVQCYCKRVVEVSRSTPQPHCSAKQQQRIIAKVLALAYLIAPTDTLVMAFSINTLQAGFVLLIRMKARVTVAPASCCALMAHSRSC
jgi:hypothetical protein